MKTDCPRKEDLLLFLSGEMVADEAAALEAHAQTCESCTADLSWLRSVTVSLSLAGRSARSGDPTSVPVGDCPDPERLAGYADGSIAASQAHDVESHLATCHACFDELADIWSLSGSETHDASAATVASVLAKLQRDSRTAVLRWTDDILELVRDFGRSVADAAGSGAPRLEPGFALSRTSRSAVRLRWAGTAGAVVEALVTPEVDGVSLTGMVLVEGRPSGKVSVSLRSDDVRRGPESPDAAGRFGPWPLAPGENLLGVSGLSKETGGSAQLVVVVADDKTAYC